MIEVNRDPTGREVNVFGVLWLLFFAGLAAVVLWRPAGLAGAAVVLAGAWLVSLAFNAADRRAQLAGAFLPFLFGASGGLVQLGVPAAKVGTVFGAVGIAGALLLWVAPRVGRKAYVGWMLAAVPIGWTLSHLVLAAVYYLVLTPIGLILRLVGHDPMKRGFDREAKSYWIRRKTGREPSRYFRQF